MARSDSLGSAQNDSQGSAQGDSQGSAQNDSQGSAQGEPIPWEVLRTAAIEAAQTAYAPYSQFQVGAAALVDDGRVITGCNVENVSYGLTLCAECGLVSTLHATGGGRLVAVVTVSGSGEPCTPCGRCRQLLLEHGGPDCLVDGDGTPRPASDLLPGGFTPERMATERSAHDAAEASDHTPEAET